MSFRKLLEGKVKSKNGVELSGNISDKKEAIELADSYDFYTNFIDNGGQKRSADKQNSEILKALKELGVTEVSYPNYQNFSGDKIGKKFEV